MSESKIIDPRKIIIREFKIVKAMLECPDDYQVQDIASFTYNVDMETECSLEESLVKAALLVSVNTVSNEKSEEVSASFRIVFIYHYEDLADHAVKSRDGVALDPYLANAIASVTYSTSRGILISRFQDTPLRDFILPIVDPQDFVRKD